MAAMVLITASAANARSNGLEDHLLSKVGTDGLGGVWRFPVTRSRTTNRMRKPCTCLEDARKLHFCSTCREIHMAVSYQKRFRKRVAKLGRETSKIWVGEVLPSCYENPGPQQKYQCYVCRGFLIGMTFNLRLGVSRFEG